MTSAAAILDPATNPAWYVSAVLAFYLDLPDTPWRYTGLDQTTARGWFDRGIALPVVEAALLLACLRRLSRPAGVPPLPRVRSLAYFQPVVEELLENPPPEGYLPYLRLKLRRVVDRLDSNDVQKSTFPDDR